MQKKQTLYKKIIKVFKNNAEIYKEKRKRTLCKQN